MLDTARKLVVLLDRRERIQLCLLLLAALLMALLEVVSVGAVLPFLSVAADPARVQDNAWLARAYDGLGFTSINGFLIMLGCAAVLALVLSNTCMAITAWEQVRFASGRVHSLARRLLRHYAAQPYVFFLRRNSADLGKNVLNEAEQVVNSVLMPALTFTARAIVALAIVGFLVAFDPALAALVALVFGGAYGVVYTAMRRKLARIGVARLTANAARYKAANELFGAIKDVKLLGKEDAFTAAFVGPSARYARYQATAAIMGRITRYVLETMAFGGVLVIAAWRQPAAGHPCARPVRFRRVQADAEPAAGLPCTHPAPLRPRWPRQFAPRTHPRGSFSVARNSARRWPGARCSAAAETLGASGRHIYLPGRAPAGAQAREPGDRGQYHRRHHGPDRGWQNHSRGRHSRPFTPAGRRDLRRQRTVGRTQPARLAE